MSYKENIKGSCLCGAVRYTAQQIANAIACHCHMCRRHCSGTFHSVPVRDFELLQLTDALCTHSGSEWAERTFCNRCGTGIYYRIKNTEHYGLSMGSIDSEKPPLTMHIHVDNAEVTHDGQSAIWDNLPQMTGREFMDHIGMPADIDDEQPAIADMNAPCHEGGCTCGGVRYRASNTLDNILVCHCGQCEKQASSYYRATETSSENFTLFKADTLSWYSSSDDAERGFCHRCGSTLFWRKKTDGFGYRGANTGISILVGTFDARLPLPLEAHIFTADASGAYSLPDIEEVS